MKYLFLLFILLPVVIKADFISNSEAKQRAYFFYQRITGTPPDVSSSEFEEVWNLIEAGDEYAAALKVTESKNLINIKLKNFLKDWTNRAVNKNVNTNDMLYLMLGLIRDGRDFREVLTTDDVYKLTLDGLKYTFPPNGEISRVPGAVSPFLSYFDFESVGSYNIFQNKLSYNRVGSYEEIVYVNADNSLLNLDEFLTSGKRIVKHGDFVTNDNITFTLVDASDRLYAKEKLAGVITTDHFASEFFNAGTNRRATQYLFKNFLCMEFNELADTTIDTQYVRRDVDRFPNGDIKTYLNFCVGCHAGQDRLGQAFYYYDKYPNSDHLWFRDDQSFISRGKNKLNKNVVFEDGFVVGENSQDTGLPKDMWSNLWSSGKNKDLGWSAESTWKSTKFENQGHAGVGVKDLGEYLSKSSMFNDCMAERMWEMVCVNRNDEAFLSVKDQLSDFFANENYNMKSLIAQVATLCPYEVD